MVSSGRQDCLPCRVHGGGNMCAVDLDQCTDWGSGKIFEVSTHEVHFINALMVSVVIKKKCYNQKKNCMRWECVNYY